MSTQSTPAGWYPDPTGKSGQMYWDGQQWQQDQTSTAGSGLAPLPGTQPAPVRAQQPPGTYAYKNPVLYGLGGVFFPPLVLFLMGGSRATCAWMMGLWVLFWLTIWVFLIGVLFMIPLYIWSVVACYQEAVKQNQALGFAS
jgi:Protein of unknown function (DUF2510)